MKTASEIAYELQGSCDSLEAVLERHEMEGMENNSAFCAEIDALVFCCTKCDWWFEQSEMSDDPAHDWECRECAED